MGKPKTQRTDEPYFAPNSDTLAEVKALTLREEFRLMAQADPDEVYQAEDKGRQANGQG